MPAQQREKSRRELDQAFLRSSNARRVERQLPHVESYLRQLEGEAIEFASLSDRWKMEAELKNQIRPILLSEILEDPEMSDQDIKERIEQLADESIAEIFDA